MVPRLLIAFLVLAGLSDALRRSERGATEEPVPTIPGTDVPVPPHFEDYARGRRPLAVWPSTAQIPGHREKAKCPGEGLPCFDPADRNGSAEAFLIADGRDELAKNCSPGNQGLVGHLLYNVWVPEIVPFVVPEGTPGRKDAAVLIAPGGGFVHLAWDLAVAAADWFNSEGISAFVLKYRLPNYEVSLLDTQRAMSLIRSGAGEYGINASRIGFYGGSAGGNLGLRVGCAVQRSYQRIDAVDDVGFRPNFLILNYPAHPGEDEYKSGSPSSLSLELLPPAFVSYAADDTCVPATDIRILLRDANKMARTPVEAHEFPEGGHGYSFPEYFRSLAPTAWKRPWKRLALDWMRRIGVV